jgi:signal transduction histidine kinase/ActR/RegA family two-component response regulator
LLVIEDQQGEKRFFLGQRGDKSVFSDLPLPPEVLAYVRKELQPVCWHMPDQVGGIQGCPALVLPFASPRSVYGWICLLGKGDAAAFTSEDEEIAMMLSNKGALAYENILLIEQLQKSEEYLEDLVRERTAELEKAKNELVKIEKLESLGVLAGGIAHDFNNALTAIIGHIQLAKIKTDSGEEVFTNLDLAEAACVNAQSLTRQLLTFAKGGQPLKKTAALPALIKDTVINALKDSNIRSTFSFPADLALVEIDQGQIKQVITNLVLNARQALSASGNISISAMNIRVSSGAASPLIPGKYVKLSIADQGEGIAPEHLANIFDPYFTTKEKGNGLGLATAYSIVKNHDGHITVESKAGVGTTFHILLPALEQARFCTPTGQQKSNRQGRILLIEDHELIAQSLAELLRLYGYEVDAVADGRDGLKLYLENMEDGRKYDAVIMDLTIPGGMGGKETIQHLRKIDPDVAAIVASGYSNDPVMSNFREYGFCSALPKPYKIEDMVRELQRIHS